MPTATAADTLPLSIYPELDTAALANWQPLVMPVADTVATVAVPSAPPEPAWTHGLEPAPRQLSAGADPGITALLVCLFVAVALSYRHCRHLLGALYKELWTVRRRRRDYDEHTADETWVMALLGVQLVVYLGVLVDVAVGHASPAHVVTVAAAWPCIAMVGAYYVFELLAYSTIGYVFAPDDERRRSWLRGFNASQVLLGCALALPAIVAVFYPAVALPMLAVCAVLYVAARLTFIAKGFRIFYDNFGSLLYFILYLCSLEIVPLVICYKIGLALAKIQ